MKIPPKNEGSLMSRTDFTDDSAWESICESISQPVDEFAAIVDCLSDRQYDRLTVEQLTALIPEGFDHTFAFIVDQMTFAHPEQSVLVVDLSENRGDTFRVVPSAMWAVENNLSIGNMDFREFAQMADEDGILRGIPGF